ncbi:hypothetical protein [Microcystis aeruginosa]|nr:hypothetical protein [Microcystis aeruginosa]MDB9392567.1 hypothetical protein [Microcystis aeruginosa CS-579]
MYIWLATDITTREIIGGYLEFAAKSLLVGLGVGRQGSGFCQGF